ncbi:MAG: DivIVA domain-containing protein [Gemmatimonadales bacterium]|nr:MAG: DivIVA domain-containing protein [Gemmatimonadales bacterium]
MIDLTPLDVRNKRGDFRRGMRGYEPQEVDAFLESVADRMDILVRENMALRERTEELKVRVERQDARENAVQEALVSAQALREEIRAQAAREAELQLREAKQTAELQLRDAEQEAERRRSESEHQAERVREEIERALADGRRELEDLHRSRARFLRAYRSLLEREMDVVEMEEERRKADDLRADPDAPGAEGAEPEASADGDAIEDPYDAAGAADGADGADDPGNHAADAALAIDISPDREGRLPEPRGHGDTGPRPDPFRHG